ncbi:MAG: GNAT family N-acetyltransferase [Leptolyngbyaceae cyanobacterium bins.59]|nr:GNAT family N-acetyltransferase [Leptolyngbyaceae cyanobacterium bins.59]
MNSFSTSEALKEILGRSALPQLTIRTVLPKDISSLAELLTDSFHPRSGLVQWVHPLLRMGIHEDLRNRLRGKHPHYICLVAGWREEVSGSGAFSRTPEYLAGTIEMALRPSFAWNQKSQYLYVSNLAVRVECRRRGIAQQLLLACEHIALSWGFHELYLHVLEDNYQARNLYYKCGYDLKEIDYCWSLPFYRPPRRLLLHKHLSTPLANH